MLMGPTKKKVITAGVVSFLIPTIVATAGFVYYSNQKKAEIEILKEKSKTVDGYVFAKEMTVGEVITAEDVVGVGIKSESAPFDYYRSGDLVSLVGRRVKINAEAKTIVTSSMLMEREDLNPSIDERLQEYSMISLPSDLEEGDFIDIRITTPQSEDYIVISGKEVKKIGSSDITSNTIWIQLTEEEIIRMSAAIIETYITDGMQIYATKYVDPSSQLYSYERVDFVEKYKEALEELIKERQKLADEKPEEYLALYNLDLLKSDTNDDYQIKNEEYSENVTPIVKKKTDKIVVTADDITIEEIAEKIDLSIEETNEIKDAIDNQKTNILDMYNDVLVTTRKNMVNTYPVKSNIAKLIQENPNIVEKVKAKYDIEELEKRRSSFVDFTLYEINDEGETTGTDALNSLKENLDKEIELKKNERKEYIQSLLLNY